MRFTMSEGLKCPHCGGENLTRMDGSGTVKKYGNDVMIDIAPDIVYCNDCKKEFRAPLFDGTRSDGSEALP